MKTLLAFIFFICQYCVSQNKINYDVIIHNDGHFVSDIYKGYIKCGDKNIPFEYYPGNFIIDKDDLEKIRVSENCILNFIIAETKKNEFTEKHYEIEFPGDWFNSKYILLDIYNMSCRNSKKIYNPLPNKDYTFTLSNGQRMLLRERK